MSNYNYESVFEGDQEVILGYETVNGTGQVYIDADKLPRFLSNEEARELADALMGVADDALRRRWEIEERMYRPRQL